jgi:hypothetical protein
MKQIDIFGNENEPAPGIKKGRPKYRSMQSLHGVIKGKTCKTCKHLMNGYYHGKSYYKCELWVVSHSSATDIRLKTTACKKYEEN